MPPAAAIIGASALGAVGSAVAGNQAAGAAQAAANQSNQTQRYMFDTANALNAPWRNQGTAAVNLLGNAYTGQPGGQEALNNAFFQSPGYQFRLDQGQQQLDRMAARGGNFFSGRGLNAAQEYGQNFASNEFGNYINQLNALSGLGSGAASQSGSNAIQTGALMGQNFTNAGNARAGAYMNTGNALNSLIGQGIGAYGMGLFGGGGSNVWGGWGSGSGSGAPTINNSPAVQTQFGTLFGNDPYSDRRLKRDIEPVGTHKGLTVYAFRYLWDDALHYGYMADEVEKVAPDAVSEDANGFKRVNYAKVH